MTTNDPFLRPIRSEEEYAAALAELDRRMNLVDAAPSLDSDHTKVLAILIEHWERARFEIDPPRLRCRVWHYPQDDEYEGLIAYGHLGRQMFRSGAEKYLDGDWLEAEEEAAMRRDLARGEPEHVWGRSYTRGPGLPKIPTCKDEKPPEGFVRDFCTGHFIPVECFYRYEDADEYMGLNLCERADRCAEPYTIWRVPEVPETLDAGDRPRVEEDPHPARTPTVGPSTGRSRLASGRGEDAENRP